MPVAATGIYSTAYRLKLLLANCAAVQSLLEVDSAEDAIAKISTYSAEDMGLPRVLIVEHDVTFEKVDVSIAAQDRQLDVFLDFYVPEDAGTESTDDEHSWVLTQLGDVTMEALELSGTGEPVDRTTHLNIHTMTMQQPERWAHDERTDEDSRARWVGIYTVTLL